MDRMTDAFDAVKQAVTARDVADALGLAVDRNGRCRCLWHDDRHPSMKLYDGDRGCYCFACHNGGSVIDMVMRANGCTLPEALRWLNETFRIGLDLDGSKPDRAALDAANALRERRRREREQAHEEQMRVFDLWADTVKTIGELKDDIEKYRPKTAGEAWDARFCGAMKRLTEMEELAAQLEDKMRWKGEKA